MTTHIYDGRYTTKHDSDFVVFVIGMRINRFWAFSKWFPVFIAMNPMIRELEQDPESGFHHAQYFLNWRGVTLIQYWRSYEDLDRYSKGKTHKAAWKRYNQFARNSDAVGVYHETYIVQRNHSESIYVNMPKFGLAKAFEHEPISHHTETSRERIGLE